jgi:hypothetical protein
MIRTIGTITAAFYVSSKLIQEKIERQVEEKSKKQKDKKTKKSR